MRQVVEEVGFGVIDFVELSEGIEAAELGHEYEDESLTPEEFAEFLILNREVLGYRQCQMAEILGVNKNAYNAYERAKRIPKNWEVFLEKVRILVKDKQRSVRMGEEYSNFVSDSMKESMIEMHRMGRNIVQISIELGIEEGTVRDMLISAGYTPTVYRPSWLSDGLAIDEYAGAENDEELGDDDDEVVA